MTITLYVKCISYGNKKDLYETYTAACTTIAYHRGTPGTVIHYMVNFVSIDSYNILRNKPLKLTTIHPIRRKMTTPKILMRQEVKTPSQVPNKTGSEMKKLALYQGLWEDKFWKFKDILYFILMFMYIINTWSVVNLFILQKQWNEYLGSKTYTCIFSLDVFNLVFWFIKYLVYTGIIYIWQFIMVTTKNHFNTSEFRKIKQVIFAFFWNISICFKCTS